MVLIGDIEQLVYTGAVMLFSTGIGVLLRGITLFIIKKIVAMRHGEVAEELLRQKTLHRCSHVIPPLVFLCLIPFTFTADRTLTTWIMRIGGIYMLVAVAVAVSAVMEFLWVRFDRHENRYNHPLKGVLNIGKGVVWVIITVVSIAILLDKSPMSLLAGLGAFAAALMLIFKDSILGFVAGIQLSQNDMLRVGDWIVVPSTIANGIVVDVTLSVVKIRNWDNTIVMLPPYTLVSTSFQNWRGMSEAGTRLFNRTIIICQQSICNATDRLIADTLRNFPEMADYIKSQQEARSKGEPNTYNPSSQPNGTIDTNLGLFRAYLCLYLLHHPQVAADQDILVKLEESKPYGQPLNIYFYSRLTAWTRYAALGSEIFEHVAVTAPKFGLQLYNFPRETADFLDCTNQAGSVQ